MLNKLRYGLSTTIAGAHAGYYSALPVDSQKAGPTFTGLTFGARQIALTFDDGPNDPCTLQLLEVLEHHQVPATFFMIGRYVRRRPDIVRAVAAAGHEIANHTDTHPPLALEIDDQTRIQLLECQQTIADITGDLPTLFRPPFGSRRPATIRIASELGLRAVMWNVMSFDWTNISAAEIENNVVNNVRGGDVVLLHDGGHLDMSTDRSRTVVATDNIIRRLKDAGYEFVTVTQMLALADR